MIAIGAGQLPLERSYHGDDPQGGTVPYEGKNNWYAMKTIRLTDDFMRWETKTAEVELPSDITALDHVRTATPERG